MNIAINGVTHALDPTSRRDELYQRTACSVWSFVGSRESAIAARAWWCSNEVDCMACIATGYALCTKP